MRLLLPLALLPLLACAQRPSFVGRVVGVSDGDTIRVLREGGGAKKEIKVRLHGVDAPESKQPFGTRSKQFTSDMVFRKTVRVEVRDTDRYGRTVGWVTLGGKSLNLESVRAGMAWWYRQYAKGEKALEKAEAEARAAKRPMGGSEPRAAVGVPPERKIRAGDQDRADDGCAGGGECGRASDREGQEVPPRDVQARPRREDHEDDPAGSGTKADDALQGMPALAARPVAAPPDLPRLAVRDFGKFVSGAGCPGGRVGSLRSTGAGQTRLRSGAGSDRQGSAATTREETE